MAGQRYLLQKRSREGHLKKVETFNEAVTQDYVLRRYGPGYYVLKSTKPRFKVIWKNSLGTDKITDAAALNRKVNFTLVGFVTVLTTEAVGFGLTHNRLCRIEARLDRIETALRFQPAEGLFCDQCHANVKLLQNYCGNCGVELNWPRKPIPHSLNEASCANCHVPVLAPQTYCTNCGQVQPLSIWYQVK